MHKAQAFLEEEEKEAKQEESSMDTRQPKTIKVTKNTKDEPLGLALRNSSKTDGIYVYGIFGSSKLCETELHEGMRILSINGETFKKVPDVIEALKSSTTLDIVVTLNDE